MQIETLKIFCDLAETKSFSQAAERNFVTQSAVSQQVRGLEEKFKHTLLERVRGRRAIHLTAAGETFYQESRSVLAAFDQLQEQMRAHTGTVSGTVRVSTVYSIGLHELPAAVRKFMALYPAAKIDLEYSRTTRIVRDVLSGAVELGIVAFPEKRRGLTVVPLPGDRLVLVCPPAHPLAARKKVKAVELDKLDFVLFERDIPTRRATDRILKSYNVTVHRVAEFDNIETIKRAVEVGFGAAILPRPSVVDEQRSGQLAIVALAEPEWMREVGAIHRSDRKLGSAAQKFVELLAQPSRKAKRKKATSTKRIEISRNSNSRRL